MAAVPLGTVIGSLLLARFAAPSAQVRNMDWLAMASCAPLVGCAWSPPLPVVLILWLIACARSRDSGSWQAAPPRSSSARPWQSAWPACSAWARRPCSR